MALLWVLYVVFVDDPPLKSLLITCIDLMGSLKAQCENRAPNHVREDHAYGWSGAVHLFYGVERVRIPRITHHTLLNRLQIAPSPLLSSIINLIPSLNS